MEVLTLPIRRKTSIALASVRDPGLTTSYRLNEPGCEAVGQFLEPDRAVLALRVVDGDPWCQKCGAAGRPRDTVTRPAVGPDV